MPELEINLNALAHNLRLIRRQEQAWGFRFLPVLKMVASHPDVVDFLRTQGYARYGIADMTEHLLYGQEPPARTGRVLINLAPPDRADDVVRLFERSAFSCESTFRALDAAARAAGLHHEGTVLSARPLRVVFPGELPLRSGPVGREIVRERSGGFLFRRLFFRRTGNRGGPAVFGHGDGFDQRLPTQRVESPFIGVVNDVPLSVGGVDQRPVSFRTPALVRGVGMYQRVVRAVFPRAG